MVAWNASVTDIGGIGGTTCIPPLGARVLTLAQVTISNECYGRRASHWIDSSYATIFAYICTCSHQECDVQQISDVRDKSAWTVPFKPACPLFPGTLGCSTSSSSPTTIVHDRRNIGFNHGVHRNWHRRPVREALFSSKSHARRGEGSSSKQLAKIFWEIGLYPKLFGARSIWIRDVYEQGNGCRHSRSEICLEFRHLYTFSFSRSFAFALEYDL